MKKAKNRTARPISSRDTMHMILKSSVATGRFSLRHSKNLVVVRKLVAVQCQKYGVKLIKYSNNSNHLHLHLKFASRALYLKLVRSLTAAIAMAVTGASKLKIHRPFTRVVRSLRELKSHEKTYFQKDFVRSAEQNLGFSPAQLNFNLN